MTSVGGKCKLVGFANLGKAHDLMRELSGMVSLFFSKINLLIVYKI